MTTIEQLSIKYFKHSGCSPELDFWMWLGAMGAEPNEAGLLALLKDQEMWRALKESESIDDGGELDLGKNNGDEAKE